MKKILLTVLLVFQIGILIAQKTQSELIIGTWRFEKQCDLRTEKEKSEFVDIPWCPPETESGTGHADRIFNANNEFEFYLTKTVSEFGLYQLKNGKLIIERRIISEREAEQKSELIKWHLQRNLIVKKQDGFYYYKPLELNIKSMSENQLEFGTEKHYTIWKRIK